MYALLNAIFVALYGVTNPGQNDAPRNMVFLLVFSTLALSPYINEKTEW